MVAYNSIKKRGVLRSMKTKELFVSRGRKFTQNYQSYQYTVGMTIELCDGDNIEDCHSFLNKTVKKMELLEVSKINKQIR